MTAHAIPSPLSLAQLVEWTSCVAEDVRAGHYAVEADADQRWHVRLHRDDQIDIWLISWVPDHSTELHDHGGSLGALTLLSGALDEFRWDGETLRRRRLEAGDQAAFPLGWVHDVVWAPTPSITVPGPTLSVHAYSPPLTAMSYYDVTSRNTLRRSRTELTDGPEG